AAGRDLEDDRPTGKAGLAGEEDAALGTLPQLGEQFKLAQPLPCRGHAHHAGARIAPRRMAGKEQFELATMRGKAPEKVLALDGTAVMMAQAELFMNDLEDGRGPLGKIGMARENFFGEGPVAAVPALFHLGDGSAGRGSVPGV